MRLRPVAVLLSALLLGGCTGGAEPSRWVAPSHSPSSASPSVAVSTVPRLAAVELPSPLDVPSGSASVTQQEVTYSRGGRTLRTVIWTPDRPAKAPAVLFSHGLNGAPEHFAPLLRRWAQAGYVVIAPAYPNTTKGAKLDVYDVLNQPADASYVLGLVLASPVGERIDADRLAAAGHSAGAITTVGLFTTGRDKRLRAGIVMAGSGLGVGTAFSGTPAAMLFVHGTADPLVSYASGKAAYDAVPWAKAMLTLSGGNHNDPYLTPSSASFQRVAASTLAFLRLELYGDQAARRSLEPSGDLDSHL